MFIIPLFIAIPLFAAFALPIVARFKMKWVDPVANGALALLFILSILAVTPLFAGSTHVYKMGGWPAPIGINLVLDGLSTFMLFTVSFVSLIISIFGIEYMKRFTAKGKYCTLFMLMVAGMNGVILTGDFFNMFIFVEIAALASYALVAFGVESEELEASFKYMIMGSIASIMILIAMILLYSLTGTLNMAEISNMVHSTGLTTGQLIIVSLFIMGFGLKGALVPFHAWLPDAHPSAPAPISAMLSGVLIKAVGIYALMRIIFNVFSLTPAISSVLMTLGVASMLVGVFLAIYQWDLKRLLAYHSISQMGYVVLGLSIGSPLGVVGGLFHLFNHATFKSLLFLNSGALEYSTGTRDLRKMGGLGEKMKITSITSLFASMAIAGVPPFNGFFSKLIIIMAAVLSKNYLFAFLAALASILTLSSFLKVEKYAFFGELKDSLKETKEVPSLMCASMITLAATCVLVGLVFPYFISVFIDPAARVLTDGLAYGIAVLGK
ncbi:MAG: proton-conducting transporter membrane subunit [Candidatus Saganbacteria bacterium]|nr:proton-conducting transporter membrane subunit [Candidatus Saganbacteria bacterium]